MEPLTFKIITDADDSGVKKYDSSLGGLNTTSQKAGAALRAFSRDALEAKSGADLAAAGANALSQALQKSLGATAAIGAVKIISDQIKNMAGVLREVGNETAKAVAQIQKLGEPKGIAEATKQADLLSAALEKTQQRIGEISSSNLVTRGLASITGVKAELEAQAATLQRLRDATILLGLESEAANKKALIGASDYDKAFLEINKKLQQNLLLVQQIKDENLRAAAQKRADDIASIELMSVMEKQEADRAEKSMEYRQKIRDAEHKAQISFRDAIIEAEKLGEEFDKADEERKNKYIERAKERIKAIDNEIKALEARNEALRSGMAEDVLLTSLSRGPGQAPTSEEVGYLKKADREVEAERQRIANAEIDAEVKRLQEAARIKQKEEGSFYQGQDPETIGKREARKSLARQGIEERKAKDPLISSAREMDKNNDAIAKNTQARQEETDNVGKSSEGFFRMGEATDIVNKALGGTGKISDDLSDSFDFSTESSNRLKDSFDNLDGTSKGTNQSFGGLSGSAANASAALDAIGGIQEVLIIKTHSIILEAPGGGGGKGK